MKISTTWSSSRMATRVSCAPEEMIISLFMENAPAAAAQRADDADILCAAKYADRTDNFIAAERADAAERQQEYGAHKHVQLLIVHVAVSAWFAAPANW